MVNSATRNSIAVNKILTSRWIVNYPAKCANLTSNARAISVTIMGSVWAKYNMKVVQVMKTVIQDFSAILHPPNVNYKNKRPKVATQNPNAKII